MIATTPTKPARTCLRALSKSQPARLFSSSSHSNQQQSAPLSPRWLSDTKARLGKLTTKPLPAPAAHKLASLSQILANEWRALVAGSEGFLTSERDAGLLRHRVVWGEMDSMAHVNNVQYVRWAESARVNWCTGMALHRDPENEKRWRELMTPKGEGLILKSIRVDYKFPMTYPDHVSVFHKLASPPDPNSTSFHLDVLILSEGEQRAAARCWEDIVVYNYPKAKKINMPGFMVEQFSKIWKEQEQEKRRALGRVAEVEGMLGELEGEVKG